MSIDRFDDDVLGPILGRDADDPALLWELLSSVDAVHQTFIDVDELNAALGLPRWCPSACSSGRPRSRSSSASSSG